MKPKNSTIFILSGYLGALLALYLCGTCPRFAAAVNDCPGAAVRVCCARLSGFLPLPLLETGLLLIPVLTGVLLVLVRRHGFRIPAVAGMLLLWLYVLTVGAGAHTPPLSPGRGAQPEEVRAAAAYLDGFLEDTTPLPSFQETERQLRAAAASLGIPLPPGRLKRLSPLWAQAGVRGVYSFLTGEAGVVADGDPMMPCAAAHELMHTAGVMRDDEATFLGALLCLSCDHPALRRCGALRLLSYLSGSGETYGRGGAVRAANRLSGLHRRLKGLDDSYCHAGALFALYRAGHLSSRIHILLPSTTER